MPTCYIGVGNTPKKIKNIYIGVNGKPVKVKKGYIGVNGSLKLFYSDLSLTWAGLLLPTLTQARADLTGMGGANVSPDDDKYIKYGFFAGGLTTSNGLTTVDRISTDLNVSRMTDGLTAGRSKTVAGQCGYLTFFIQGLYNMTEGGDSSIDVYNNENGTKVKTMTSRAATYAHAGGTVSNSFMVWGGGVRTANTNPVSTVQWTDGLAVQSDADPLPEGVSQLGYAACNGKGFFFGGLKSDKTLSSTVSMYNLSVVRSPADSLSMGVEGSLGASTPNYAYRFGGFDNKGIDRWNQNGTRQSLSHSSSQYHGFGTAVGCGPWAMAIGGEDAFENTLSQITYCNDDGTVAIMNILGSSNQEVKLERCAAIALGDQIIIAGGVTNTYNGTRQDKMYLISASY